MRRDKTVARILLILSVVHVAVAVPGIVRQRSLDVDEDVTAASEKRGDPPDTTQNLFPVPQTNSEQPTTSGTKPELQSDPLLTSGSRSETLPVHDAIYGPAIYGPSDFPNEKSYQMFRWVHGLTPVAPPEEGAWLNSEPKPPAPPPSSPLELETRPPPPEAIFSNAINKKLKISAVVGAVAGVTAGVAYGVHKLIQRNSQKAKPTGRDLTSSDVGRKPVSRALSNLNLRNEDLRLLNVLTRRALERLD